MREPCNCASDIYCKHMEATMNKIEVYSNWCYFDRLDGRDLEDGEQLVVKFPDDKERTVTVKLVKSGYDTIEQGGHTTWIPTKTAYAPALVWGVEVAVPLRGLEARRV